MYPCGPHLISENLAPPARTVALISNCEAENGASRSCRRNSPKYNLPTKSGYDSYDPHRHAPGAFDLFALIQFPRHGLPATCVAGAAGESGGRESFLCRDRAAYGISEGSTGSRGCLRREQSHGRHSLSPRGPQRRFTPGIHLGSRTQARSARPGKRPENVIRTVFYRREILINSTSDRPYHARALRHNHQAR
jgi:hypothetical protein